MVGHFAFFLGSGDKAIGRCPAVEEKLCLPDRLLFQSLLSSRSPLSYLRAPLQTDTVKSLPRRVLIARLRFQYGTERPRPRKLGPARSHSKLHPRE